MVDPVKQQALSVASKAATGLACLVLVGRQYGLNLSVEQLIHDNLLVVGEIDKLTLLRCARRAGFRCNLLRLDWTGVWGLDKALPAIAFLNDGSSVVVARTELQDGAPCVVVLNPETAAEALVARSQFEEIWSGDIILIRRNFEDSAQALPFGFRLISQLVFEDKGQIVDIAISALMMSALALMPIVFFSAMSAYVLPTHAKDTFWFVCLVGFILVVFEGLFLALRTQVLGRLTARVDRALSTYMFDRLLSLPIEFFETTPIGIISYKVGQMTKVRTFLTGQLFSAVLDGSVLVIFVPIMIYVSPLLTAIVLGFCALSAAWIIAVLPSLRRRSVVIEEVEADRMAFLSQSLTGIRTVKSLALDSRQTMRWDRMTAHSAKLKLDASDFRNVIQTVMIPLQRLTISLPVSVGAYLAVSGDSSITGNTLFIFMMLSQRMVGPLVQLAQLVQQYDEARLAVEIVANVLNQPAEEGRSGYGVRVPIKGHIEFANLRFKYRGAVSPTLRSLNFEIGQGTTFGVMGRSGSGKTTITRLLQRLHSDYQGLIRIDGIDVREYDVDHLRSSLGVVLQENFLFSGSIRENITIAKSDATFEEVVHAARLAGAEEFIDKLPRGYDTMIYEGSPNLSGGQRQRIAIARALITDPKVLILDEATSALDAESEAIVNANLKRIAHGRTMIVISHRLSSLVTADAILVLDRGEVNDIGKHHELLERCDIYSGLWQRQNSHVGDAAAPPPIIPKLITRGSSGA